MLEPVIGWTPVTKYSFAAWWRRSLSAAWTAGGESLTVAHHGKVILRQLRRLSFFYTRDGSASTVHMKKLRCTRGCSSSHDVRQQPANTQSASVEFPLKRAVRHSLTCEYNTQFGQFGLGVYDVTRLNINDGSHQTGFQGSWQVNLSDWLRLRCVPPPYAVKCWSEMIIYNNIHRLTNWTCSS